MGPWLARKPARSDPPTRYAGTTQNQGRFLELVRDGSHALACMGIGPVPVTEKTTRGEFGILCISPEAGVVRVDGKWSPTSDILDQKEFLK